MAWSSSPNVPASPAWGLSPAIANRGRPIANRSVRSRATMRPVSAMSSVVRASGSLASAISRRKIVRTALGAPMTAISAVGQATL